ncbi:MAG: hypothetical protein VSS75_007140, partial [Candidatus Parabeggiatoa sp.]|nr:hypothetical protein [Candidatus Parabeggiatoa sp.]
MPLPLIGIFAVTGCLYLANKIQQKQQKKKMFKNSQPKKTIAQSVSSTKPITPRKKNDYETELNRNIILS